jgi:hypothetical protein
MPLTIQTIEELEKMDQNCSHGPWEHEHGEICHPDRDIVKQKDAFDWVLSMQLSNCPTWKDDAEFIVTMRNNLPDLLAAARWAMERGYTGE